MMTNETPRPLTVADLCQCCDPALLQASDADKTTHGRLIGQDRAEDAMEFSIGIQHRDFNLFVLGPAGTGRHTAVERLLREQALARPRPPDWVYVNNFDAPHKPLALNLPAGTATRLREHMEYLVDDLAGDIPALFDSEEYQAQRRAIDEEFGSRQEEAMADFADRARKENVALVRTPVGYMVAALKDDQVLKSEDYKKLPDAERVEIDEKIPRFQEELAQVLRNAPKLEREHRERVEALNAEMAERAVSARIEEAKTEFEGIASVGDHLDRVREDMIGNAEIFIQTAIKSNEGPFPDAIRKPHREPAFRRYSVNVMVGQSIESDATAPVETEDLPTLDRLAGRIEHVSQMGSLVTDFTLIRPGALHRANGGFLILDARRVLTEPFAWDALKRCLKKQAITITSMAERMSLVSTTSLEPDPIPLEVRVVLIGDRMLHAMLLALDPDFLELFKVHADFEETVDRSEDNLKALAGLIGSFAERENMLPIAPEGLARLLDEATRLADDAKKLSVRIGLLSDILREAEYYAKLRSGARIADDDVERAISQRDVRWQRVPNRMQEAIRRGTILIDTEGEKIGQINALSVIGIGEYRFGRPSRVTARTRMGGGELVDIEREVELGGPLHSKGVMILGGYLTSTYALDAPFSLHASLVFEQSYGGIEGDSASCAELLALLSALARLPLRQNFAVTGSVNQLGEVQAIGGVNEKIEGFFDLCAARGLSGTQGVLIPKSNIEHLMLRSRVIDAVANDKFRIIPISTVDEGLELLTGVKAGTRGPDGTFAAESANGRVEARLREFAEARRAFGAHGNGAESEGTSQ